MVVGCEAILVAAFCLASSVASRRASLLTADEANVGENESSIEVLWREGGREGGRKRGRDGGRKRRERGREGGWERGERGEGGERKEGGREGGRENGVIISDQTTSLLTYLSKLYRTHMGGHCNRNPFRNQKFKCLGPLG